MLQILPTDQPTALVLRASGTVDALQNAGALGVIRRMVRTHGRIGVLLDLCAMEHIERSALQQGLAFAAEAPHAFRTIAILGDGTWATNLMALARAHTHAEVRRFSPRERKAARAFACRVPVHPPA